MSTFKAKPIVKNKLWILEDDTHKVGSIVSGPKGTVSLISEGQKESFPSFNVLKKKYNIRVDRKIAKNNSETDTIYGFPVSGHAFNEVYDVKRKLPLFTKNIKSKSFYCAGHYAIKISGEWTTEFCPKLLLINRNQFLGPFKTAQECNEKIAGL
jgi:hypothetical protein